MKNKFWFALLLALFAVLSFWFFDSGQEVKNRPSGKSLQNLSILAFGDSLVYGTGSSGGGFVSQLSQDLDIKIYNLGKPGDSTASAAKRVKDTLSYKPDIVIIALGGNDFLQRLGPKSKVYDRLGKIIAEFQNAGAAVILLEEPGYKSIYKELAKTYKTAYVPNILDGLMGSSSLMYDRIHPNDKGYKIIAEKIKPVLLELVEQ